MLTLPFGLGREELISSELRSAIIVRTTQSHFQTPSASRRLAFSRPCAETVIAAFDAIGDHVAAMCQQFGTHHIEARTASRSSAVPCAK